MPTDAEINDPAGYQRRAAAETTTVGKYYAYLPEDRKQEARRVLRHVANTEAFKNEDGMANVALEHIWNVLTAND